MSRRKGRICRIGYWIGRTDNGIYLPFSNKIGMKVNQKKRTSVFLKNIMAEVVGKLNSM
jgi:hypothetical protein